MILVFLVASTFLSCVLIVYYMSNVSKIQKHMDVLAAVLEREVIIWFDGNYSRISSGNGGEFIKSSLYSNNKDALRIIGDLQTRSKNNIISYENYISSRKLELTRRIFKFNTGLDL